MNRNAVLRSSGDWLRRKGRRQQFASRVEPVCRCISRRRCRANRSRYFKERNYAPTRLDAHRVYGCWHWCAASQGVGLSHELWTIRLLAAHARQHGPYAGHPSLGKLAQGTVRKILAEQEVKPHKVRTTWSSAIPSSSLRWPRSKISDAA